MTQKHDTSATRAIQQAAGPSGLVAASNAALEPFFKSARALRPGPVGFKVREQAFQPRLTTSGLIDFVRGASGGMAEDGSRLFVPHREHDDLTIDIWRTDPLQKEKALSFPGLGGFYEQVKPVPARRKLLEAVAFLGSRHLALCLGDGRFLVSRIDGHICIDERLGGSLGAFSPSTRLVAVSVFPGNTSASDAYCGVKLYDKRVMLEKRRLEVRSYFSPDLLHRLPYTLRLGLCEDTLVYSASSTEDGARMLNMVRVASVASRDSRQILQEEDSQMTHDLSNLANDGSYAVVGRQEVFWFGPDHSIRWQCPRPAIVTGGCPGSLLMPDGRDLWIAQWGRVVVLTRGSTESRDLLGLGHITLLGEHDSVVYVIARDASDYRVLAIDASSLEVIRDSAPMGGIEPIRPSAYDITRTGALCAGDGEGKLRVFDKTLKPTGAAVPTRRGAASAILSDPFADRLLVQTSGGAVLKYVPGDSKTELYVKCVRNRPAETGEALGSMMLSGRQDYPAFFWAEDQMGVCDGARRTVVARSDSEYRVLEVDDYNWNWEGTFSPVGKFPVPSPVTAITLMKGMVVLCISTPKLLVFDAMQLDRFNDESVLMQPGPQCMHVPLPDGSSPARGLCVAGDDRLVMWTAQGVSVVTFSRQWEIRAKRSVELPGIRNIRWDSKNARLLLAHDHHLSVCTEDVVEIGRLYLLPQGRQLVHIPYPPALRTGLKTDHPGYYWTDAENAGEALLEVTDRESHAVTDSRLREEFLGQFRSEFMVRQALAGDYSRWVEALRDPMGRARNLTRHALLPCLPGCDVDPERQLG